MKKLATVLICLLSLAATANDGVYFTSGNQLVPTRESDIAIVKEVLTISLCDDGFARVDVQYEFMNPGQPKTITMGFEASPPYNSGDIFNPKGVHPHIFDFTATLNGERLAYRNAVVASPGEKDTDFEPVDLKKWKQNPELDENEGGGLYDAATDSILQWAYSYCFTARFNSGLNKIHHTYRYRLANGVGRTFELTYWLTPAMRWANHQIDDFTLRIKAENTAKHFCVTDSIFQLAPFNVTEGEGKVRKTKFKWSEDLTEIALRNGTVEWHAKDFKPVENLNIISTDAYVGFDEQYPLGSFYDRSEQYVPNWRFESKSDARILRNLPYASRGYVFKDKKLQDYFSKLWWYMPDPKWQTSTVDFTKREWRLINKGE